jgi:cation transport ATPase
MLSTVARNTRRWLSRRSALLLLVATAVGLAAGGLARLAGATGIAHGAWLAAAGLGLGYALWSAAESLRRGRVGVDAIALLALAGAAAVREFLAAAVISVMLTSGRTRRHGRRNAPATT